MFIFGEAIDKKKLSVTLAVSEEQINEAAKELSASLSESGRGIILADNAGKLMLVTKPEHSVLVEKFVTEDLKEDLTPAALETLSIVAYFGPATRAQIDYLRGVNSSFILRSLSIRGLVIRKNKGNAYEYEISFDFLKFMGIDHVSKMPNYEEYQKLKEQYFSAKTEEVKPSDSVLINSETGQTPEQSSQTAEIINETSNS